MLNAVAGSIDSLTEKQALVGLDGFVDKMVSPVKQRQGSQDRFEPFATLGDFAAFVSTAKRPCTHVELYAQQEKIGGQGPILANTLLANNLKVKYIGALGYPTITPIFQAFATATHATSLCEPAITQAIEFSDGNLILNSMASWEPITYDRIIAVVGEGAFIDSIARAHLIALNSRTRLPNMSSILTNILHKILPNLGPQAQRHFFFDITDPNQRSQAELQSLLNTLVSYQSFGAVSLSLDTLSAQQVVTALKLGPGNSTPQDQSQTAAAIREELAISSVNIRGPHSTAAATRHDIVNIGTHFCNKTNSHIDAGDYYNAGLAIGLLLELDLPLQVTLANCFANYYTQTTQTPNVITIENFFQQ